MNLSAATKVGYSDLERRVFDTLKQAPKSTVDITDAIYGRKKRPTYARQTVLGALNNLSRKVKTNREPFHVLKSEREGPHPIQFWIEAK